MVREYTDDLPTAPLFMHAENDDAPSALQMRIVYPQSHSRDGLEKKYY
jgi:hypothetical protein